MPASQSPIPHKFFKHRRTASNKYNYKRLFVDESKMSLKKQRPLATSATPGLLSQVGMAGGAAVITVSFIHPIDVVKVCKKLSTENKYFCRAKSLT
jgi:hypothetical protein